MKSKIIILVGPPLSGKDTYLDRIDKDDYIIISRDDILLSLHGTKDYLQAFKDVDQKIVDKILKEKIKQSSELKKNVIINMTNLSKKTRKRHLSKFHNSDYEKIAVVFPKLTTTQYQERNEKRKKEENKYIPQSVLISMLESWEDVTTDEGFDQIIKL